MGIGQADVQQLPVMVAGGHNGKALAGAES